MNASDWRAAMAMTVDLTGSDWTDNGVWLLGLKRLIEIVSRAQR